MLTEQYCSYEVAKLLKEKGFDEPCSHFYKFGSNELYCGTVMTNSSFKDAEIYNSCTHQMAMAWLREKGVFVYVEPFIVIDNESYNLKGYKPWITTFKTNWFNPLRKQGKNIYAKSGYDEAIEAALKYCLENLI